MILDPILPEIYTFIDFTKHNCFTAKKHGKSSLETHLGGEVPKAHPLPYNVYVPVREYLFCNQKAIDTIIEYLENEFKKNTYDFKNITITVSQVTISKRFSHSKEYPQINVLLEW